MGKKHIAVTIDEDTHRLAAEKGLNISAIADQAVYSKVHENQVTIKHSLTCDFCGGEGEKATKETAQDPEKMIWIWPDEKWLHNRCWNRIAHNKSIVASVHQ